MERPTGFTPQFTCRDCPARYLAEGEFNVVDAEDSFDYPRGADGYRLSSEGDPTCIHPHKVGLPESSKARRLEEAGMPPVRQIEVGEVSLLEVPSDSEEFVEWIVRQLYSTPASDVQSMLDAIQQAASARYTDEEIVSQLRVAFSLLENIRSEEI